MQPKAANKLAFISIKMLEMRYCNMNDNVYIFVLHRYTLYRRMEAMRKYTRMTWEQWYQLAKEYYENYHDLRVPGRYQTSQGVELGRWIERQRTAYHGSGKYTIDKHQIYALEQIGMEWELRRRTDWSVWYALAKKYYKAAEKILSEWKIEFGPNYETGKNRHGMVSQKIPCKSRVIRGYGDIR